MIKQKELAERAGVSRPAISRYESGLSTLSKETILKLATVLNLNTAYIEGYTQNPFKSEELIKIELPENLKLTLDFSLITFITEVNSHIQLLFLMPQLSILKIAGKSAFSNPVYAIALKDDLGNTFLFRRKTKSVLNATIAGDRKLIDELNTVINRGGKDMEYDYIPIDKKLYKKISNWSVERREIDQLFVHFSARNKVLLSEHEKTLIKKLRDKQIDLDAIPTDPDEIKAFNEFRRGKKQV